MFEKSVIDLLGGGFLGYFVLLLIVLHLGAFVFWFGSVMFCSGDEEKVEKKNR